MRRQRWKLILKSCVLILGILLGINFGQSLAEKFNQRSSWLSQNELPGLAPAQNQWVTPVEGTINRINLAAEEINSRYACLIDLSTGQKILDKEGDSKASPASLTKIMTAVVVLETIEDLEQICTLQDGDFRDYYVNHAAIAGFEPGQKVAVRDLLYGVMLPSGSEAVSVLERRVAGSAQAFVELMNQKAQELGMRGTHFSNGVGLQDDRHYTTAADMASLLRYALENPQFREIFTATDYTTGSMDQTAQGLHLTSSLFDKLDNPKFADGRILGGKTGYTKKAGLCLASLAKIQEREYILVTMGAAGDPDTEQFNISDALKIYGTCQLKG